jgi:predicted nucleotide-binding protein
MVLAGLGRERVAILRKESVDEPSDMRGLIYIPFKERVEEATLPLLKALQAAKFTCKIDSL